jgi:hypothetical protein
MKAKGRRETKSCPQFSLVLIKIPPTKGEVLNPIADIKDLRRAGINFYFSNIFLGF